MARRPRASRLENRTSRLKLELREKPYDFTPLGSGISLGYRRNRSGGVWVVRVADGRGGNWTRRVGAADDHEDADGVHVFDWWQAQDASRRIARGGDADAGRPPTVADAVAEYARDLAARGAGPENATRITKNLIPTLATKPVGLLTTRDLSAWRDGLLRDGMKPATMVRLGRAVKAALNLAARRDPRNHKSQHMGRWVQRPQRRLRFAQYPTARRPASPRSDRCVLYARPQLRRLCRGRRRDRRAAFPNLPAYRRRFARRRQSAIDDANLA